MSFVRRSQLAHQVKEESHFDDLLKCIIHYNGINNSSVPKSSWKGVPFVSYMYNEPNSFTNNCNMCIVEHN
mgnify:CR=1 FL=1